MFHPDGGSVADPAVAQEIQGVLDEAASLPGVQSVSDPLDPENPSVSPDQSLAISTLTYVGLDDAGQETSYEAALALQEAAPADLGVELGGNLVPLGAPEQGVGEMIGVLAAFLVLVLTFGTLRAAGANLLVAAFGVGLGMVGVFAYGSITPIGENSIILAAMLGLAVGIDYGLFVLSRFQQELRGGRTVDDAIGRATGTAGTAVVFAGATVIVALVALVVANIGFISVMGFAAAFAVLVAVLNLTLVNAQAGVAKYLLRADVDAAERALGDIAQHTGRAIDELRATIGLLRRRDETDGGADDGDPTRSLRPVPGLAALEELVTGLASAGTEVSVSESGDPVPLAQHVVDPGRAMAHDAVAKGVDLVLVAGGDGTARTVCAALAGTGVPVALVPAGTGNLLGRNLGVPLDEDEALDVALNGVPRAVDLVRRRAEGLDADFAVMAGVGLDARIMRDTNPVLKRVARAGAYVVAGAQQVRTPPFRSTVTLDGTVVHDGEAVLTMVGNVGRLQGGVALIPAAAADDGELHVLVATGSGLRGLTRLLAGIVRERPGGPLRRARGRTVHVELDRPVPYQLDGDTVGETTWFSASVVPGSLLVMTPR